jgi:TRAP-type C4-dicarboxylate transport system, small permease component
MSGGIPKRHVPGIPLLDRIDGALCKAEKLFSVSVFVVMLTLMVVQVIFRYFLKIGIPWVEELIRFMFVATSFVAAAHLSQDRDHIAIDIINAPIRAIPDERRRERVDRSLWMLADIISLVVTYFLVLRCHHFTRNMFRTHQISPSMEVEMYIVTAFMELGFVLMAIHYLIKVLNGVYIAAKARREGTA